MSQDLRVLMQKTAVFTPRAVHTQQWGTVYVRSLTVSEVEAADEDPATWKGKSKIARGVARVICDAGGGRIFDPDSEDDVSLLARQPWPLLKQVLDAASNFNALDDKGSEEAKNG